MKKFTKTKTIIMTVLILALSIQGIIQGNPVGAKAKDSYITDVLFQIANKMNADIKLYGIEFLKDKPKGGE